MENDSTDPGEEFEPLMIAIERVTDALGDATDDQLRTAIAELHETKQRYEACCCRFAHVVKYTPPAASE
jgi:hypothetical protein